LEQRRTQRYRLQLPLQILQIGDRRLNRSEKTRDISSGGVSFFSNDSIEVGGRIEYVITLSGSTPAVRIRCLGKVLRSLNGGSEGTHPEGTHEVAVTMERYSFVRPDEVEALAISA
jgi:hypothetical protein